MTTDDRPKLIYVAQRHPRYEHEAFIRRWREHAALGMRQARWRNVALYLHCDVVEGLPPSIPSIECDGLAVVVYRSEQTRQAHLGDEAARQTMKQDELDTFAQPVAQTSLLVSAEIEAEGPLDGYRLFVLWPSAQQPVVLDVLRALVESDGGIVRNRVIAQFGGLDCYVVDEITATTVEPLCAFAARLVQDSRGGAGAQFVLTRTVVLHDQPTL